MDQAVIARTQLNGMQTKISNDMIVKAVAMALRKSSSQCILDGRKDGYTP